MDNQASVDVIEAAPPRGLGVLSVLEAQCRFPRSTDATLLRALQEHLGGGTHFSTSDRVRDCFEARRRLLPPAAASIPPPPAPIS